MLAVKGTIRDGVARPAEPLTGLDGRRVIITVLDEVESAEPTGGPPEADSVVEDYDPANDPLMQLIERCSVETGIGDLAHQHDHYLYGTPKKPDR